MVTPKVNVSIFAVIFISLSFIFCSSYLFKDSSEEVKQSFTGENSTAKINVRFNLVPFVSFIICLFFLFYLFRSFVKISSDVVKQPVADAANAQKTSVRLFFHICSHFPVNF